MSILQRISYDLKGQKRAFDLAGVDLFVGPNGSGKTTAILAIVAGLRGLAESPTDAVKPYIGPGREGSVELTFDVGTVARDLSKTRGKDAIRADMEAERIAGLHLVRWDLGDFASGTKADRNKILRRVLGSRAAADLVIAPDFPLRAELLKAKPIKGDAGEWLEDAQEWAEKEYTTANAANKTAKEGAEASQQTLGEAPPGMLSTAKEAAERLEREIAALRGEAAGAKREAEAAVKAEANRQRAAVRHAALEAELVAIGESLYVPAPDLVMLRVGVAQAKGAHQTAVMNSRARGADADAAKALLQAPRNILSAAAARHNMLVSLSSQVDSACSHCGAPDPLGILGRLAASQAEVEAANDVLQDAEIDAGLAQRTAAKAGIAVGTADDALDAATDALHAGEKVEAQRSQWRARRAQIQADLADLTEAIQPHNDAPTATFGGAEMLASLEDQLAAARKTVDLHTRHAERGRLHQEAIVKRAKADERFTAVKKLGEALKALQASEAERAFAPLSSATNELLEQMRSPFRLQVNSAADFGATDARRGGGYTSFWSLSDAERACVGAAMALALVRLSKSPWPALVMDGLNDLGPSTLESFLEGVQAAFAAGWLKNFVGAFVDEQGSYPWPAGVTRHWMGAK